MSDLNPLEELRRRQVLDEARACGRLGARRLSDSVLFGNGSDPTQTLILAALDAFEEGRKERHGS